MQDNVTHQPSFTFELFSHCNQTRHNFHIMVLSGGFFFRTLQTNVWGMKKRPLDEFLGLCSRSTSSFASFLLEFLGNFSSQVKGGSLGSLGVGLKMFLESFARILGGKWSKLMKVHSFEMGGWRTTNLRGMIGDVMFEFSQGQRGGSSTFQSWNFAESIWRIFTTTQGYRGGRNHSGCIENKLRKTIGWSYFWALWRGLWIQELCKTCAKICNYLSLCARVPGRSGRERCGGPGFLYRFMKYTYFFCFFFWQEICYSFLDIHIYIYM